MYALVSGSKVGVGAQACFDYQLNQEIYLVCKPAVFSCMQRKLFSMYLLCYIYLAHRDRAQYRYKSDKDIDLSAPLLAKRPPAGLHATLHTLST